MIAHLADCYRARIHTRPRAASADCTAPRAAARGGAGLSTGITGAQRLYPGLLSLTELEP